MARRRTLGYVRRMKSGRWQTSYLDPVSRDRVTAPETFDTKAKANRWISTAEADLARGVLVDARLAKRLFEDWAADWLVGLHVKPKTADRLHRRLDRQAEPGVGIRVID